MKIKTLRELLKGLSYESNTEGSLALPIERVVADSRQVRKGDLFIALKGPNVDGHHYIEAAIQNGAVAVVSENGDRPLLQSRSVAHIKVTNSHRAFCQLLSRVHDLDLSKIYLIGVTGTNGKTTTSYLISHLLNRVSSCGLISTIEYAWRDKKLKAMNTTPGQSVLIPILSQMVSEGVEYCVSEVSSHALDQERVSGLDFQTAIFTNLTQDHMDYHKTFEHYYESKKKLFTQNQRLKHILINADDSFGRRLGGELKKNVVTYGVNPSTQIRISNVRFDLDGSEFDLTMQGVTYPVKSRLPLYHNIYNVAAALVSVCGLGFPMEKLLESLGHFPGVFGRMERVDAGQPFYVFVDYAHTPDAFQNVLSSVQGVTKGRIITVFGCGGDRDRAKRPLMGKIASEFSDIIFLTDDNPRTEDPVLIRRDIRRGIPTLSHSTVLEVPDRKGAISEALTAAQPDDLVLILGKGHERDQVIGREAFPFSDTEIAGQFLKQQTKVTSS